MMSSYLIHTFPSHISVAALLETQGRSRSVILVGGAGAARLLCYATIIVLSGTGGKIPAPPCSEILAAVFSLRELAAGQHAQATGVRCYRQLSRSQHTAPAADLVTQRRA